VLERRGLALRREVDGQRAFVRELRDHRDGVRAFDAVNQQFLDALENYYRVKTPAPVLEVVGSTRPARWFRRPTCGPECGTGEQ